MLLETTFNNVNEPCGHPVYAFGYDFRRSNVDSGAKLVDFIAQVLSRHPGADQVIMVTHSMGGLVARAAFALNPGIMASVAGVIHGAQPSNGAVVAYRRFHSGTTPELDGEDWIMPKVKAWFLRLIIGQSPLEYTTLQVGLPGPLQLLPNHLFHKFQGPPAWLQTEPQVDLGDVYSIYAQEGAPGILLPVTTSYFVARSFMNATLRTRLALARTFHELVESAWHRNTYVLFSDGLATDARVDWTASHPFLQAYLQPLSGDTTVPADSGRCPTLPPASRKATERFIGLKHAEVFTNTNFNERVINAIRMILSAK